MHAKFDDVIMVNGVGPPFTTMTSFNFAEGKWGAPQETMITSFNFEKSSKTEGFCKVTPIYPDNVDQFWHVDSLIKEAVPEFFKWCSEFTEAL